MDISIWKDWYRETFRGYRDRRQIVGKAAGVRAGISGVSAHGVYMG